MIIYRCPRGHTLGEADFAKEMTGEPTCGACIDLNWPLVFMEKMEVGRIETPKPSKPRDPIAGHSITRI